ncbi:MAG: hypothetical protein KGL39_29245 [Patescibacteria group bacterium]|nr:hypothetical protein [Patescibacteria group bacterium]
MMGLLYVWVRKDDINRAEALILTSGFRQHTFKNPLALAIEREIGGHAVVTDSFVYLYAPRLGWHERRSMTDDARKFMRSWLYGRPEPTKLIFTPQ